MCDSQLGHVLGSGMGGSGCVSWAPLLRAFPGEICAYVSFPVHTGDARIFLAAQCCMLVLSNHLILAKGMKAQSVAVNIGLVGKQQTHCYGKVLLWGMTKSREKSLDGDQD